MILTIIFAVLVVIGCLCLFFGRRNDDLEITGMIITVIFGVAFFLSLMVICFSNGFASRDQAQMELKYTNLVKCVNAIEEYDFSTELVTLRNEVDDWNEFYFTTKYAKESKWTNWFNPVSLENVSYIEFN